MVKGRLLLKLDYAYIYLAMLAVCYGNGNIGLSVQHFDPDWNILIGCTAMKFCMDIHEPQRMNPGDFDYPLSNTGLWPNTCVGGKF